MEAAAPLDSRQEDPYSFNTAARTNKAQKKDQSRAPWRARPDHSIDKISISEALYL